jgi:type IV pilus assembly protein PilY1
MASWGSTNPFRYPQGLGVDSSNNIYVADYQQNAVRKLDSSLNLTTSYGAGSANRLDVAKKVIKKIVSDSALTSGANFGLMEWGSSRQVTVNVDSNGAKNIINRLNQIPYRGGTNLVAAMNLARNHFAQGKVANWNLDCSQNYLIVISDGYWGSNSSVTSIANQLNKSYNVKTFAVGWALGTSNSNYTSLATAGGTTTPLYADNEAQLLAKLTGAIKQVISGRVTFNTPAIIPGVTWLERVYQSTFTYKANGQWEGYLKKYYVKQDGSVGHEIWEAAEKLNKKKASDRNLWTIGLNTKSTNNFTTTYRSELRGLLFDSNPSDSEVIRAMTCRHSAPLVHRHIINSTF